MRLAATLLLALTLMACSEKAQILDVKKNVDVPAYMGAKNGFVEKKLDAWR